MATYEFVIEERTRYVVLGDGETIELAEDDAVARLLRMMKRSEAGSPISYKLVVVKKEPVRGIKGTISVATESSQGTPRG